MTGPLHDPWRPVFAMFEDVLDSHGDRMGQKGRAIAGRLKKEGMTAKEAESVYCALKNITGDPWPYVQRMIAGWRAEKGLT